MASQREKLLESAQKFILKGQIDRAIKDYQQVVALDPKDTRQRQRLAELLVRTGRSDEAVSQYEAIGKFYDDNGFYLKAIAVYKQIQKLTPDNIKVTVTLGSLNGKQGLTGNALDEYRTAVNFFEKNAQLAEAVKIIEKMLELDPENPATCQKYAELLFVRKELDRAFDAYTKLLKLLQARGDGAGAEKMETRITSLFPDRAKVSLEALAVMVDSDVDSAIGKLSGLIKQESTNLPAWKLLIRAYRKKNDHEKLKLTYELVIRLFPHELFPREGVILSVLAAGKHVEAIDLLNRHAGIFLEQSAFDSLERLYLAVQEHSDDERIVVGLRELYRQSGETDKLALLESRLVTAESELDELPPPEEEPLARIESAPEQAELSKHEVTLPESPSDALEEPVTETGEDWEEDICISIDDEDLAAELEQLEQDEASSEQDAEGPDEAAWLEPSPLFGTQSSEQEEVTDDREAVPSEQLASDEDVVDAVPPDLELAGEEVSRVELAGDEPADAELVDDELTMEVIAGEPFDAEDITVAEDGEAAMDLAAELLADMADDEELPLDLAEELPESDGLLDATDEPGILQLDAIELVEHDHLVLLTEDVEDLSELHLSDTEDINNLGEALDISQGIDQLFDKFELTLEEEPTLNLKAAKYSWDGMLSETDEQASLDDAETHFDLGIAYKEMGLYDDAIAELKRASIGPNRKLDCIILQAACCREKNDFLEAENLLFDGMTLQEATHEDVLGLKYELAMVYETSGRLEEALVIYNQVSNESPDFRGVYAKIAALEGGESSLDLTDLDYEEIEELVESPES